MQAFPDGRQAKRKRQKPDQENSLVALMRDAVQVMGTSNQVFVSDENENLARRVGHALRGISNLRLRELTKLRINEMLFTPRFDSEDN